MELLVLGEPCRLGKEKFSEETLKKAMPRQTKAIVIYYCRSKVGSRNLYFKKPLK